MSIGAHPCPNRNGDLTIESIVLPPTSAPVPSTQGTSVSESLTQRAVARAVAGRQASYAEELQRIVDAAYRVIERTSSVDPTLRDILREGGLSTQAFYRYFNSKDELLLVLLDEGARRLLGYLTHRMERAAGPEGRIRAWIEGVLAQASDTGAAGRTRPFVANEARLAEQFPVEQQASVDLLTALLVPAITELNGHRRAEARRDADAVYHLAFGALRRHLTRGTTPARAEIDHLARFALAGIGRRDA
jgi:AcrR family transcriptional regulator